LFIVFVENKQSNTCLPSEKREFFNSSVKVEVKVETIFIDPFWLTRESKLEMTVKKAVGKAKQGQTEGKIGGKLRTKKAMKAKVEGEEKVKVKKRAKVAEEKTTKKEKLNKVEKNPAKEEVIKQDGVKTKGKAQKRKVQPEKDAEGSPKAKMAKKTKYGQKGQKGDKKDSTPKTEEEKKKEGRQEQKARKEERQKKAKSEDVYSLGVQAKKIWEELRREDCKEEERDTHVQRLHALVKGKLDKIAFAHDTVRTLECLVALGTDQVRKEIFNELRDQLAAVSKAPYGHFLVGKLLKYGGKTMRDDVFAAFEGRWADLTKHKVANNVVEAVYNEYATAVQRRRMVQEFYGPEFRHFKEDELRTAAEVIAKYPEKERDLIKNLGVNVETLIKKGCYNHSMVHTVIYHYLQVCDNKAREDTAEQLREVCVHVLHSHDGARLAMHALWHGTAKDRKAIVKSFKTFVAKICTEKEGHLVMLSLFDCVDDTKLVAKAILGEIEANLEEIAVSESGRKVLMYLLAWRDTQFFHPQVLAILKEGDGNANSKKDADQRARELKDVAAPFVCGHAAKNLGELLKDNAATRYLLCVLTHAPVSSQGPLFSALAEEATKPFVPGDDPEGNLVERAATHQLLKKAIAQDKKRHEEGSSQFLSLALLEAMDSDGLEAWLTCNRGCYLLVVMLETGVESIVEAAKAKVGEMRKTLQRQKTKGAEVLRGKL